MEQDGENRRKESRGQIMEYDKLVQIVKKTAFVKLINTERNKGLVEYLISKQFLDLSAVVKIILKKDKVNMITTPLLKEDAEILGMTEEELYAIALENTVRLFPPKLMSLGKFIETSVGEKLPYEEGMVNLYILTNKEEVNGAVYFMITEVIGKIADALEDELYIFPGSVNEVYIARASELKKSVDELKEMVRDVNDTSVNEKDILSYSVYYYDKENGITIAA